MTPLTIGAYAAMPREFRADPTLNLAFQAEAIAAARGSGLEVPWGSAEFTPDPAALASMLSGTGEHVLTLITATMAHPRSARFGLASPHDDARRAAIDFTRSALAAADSLAQSAGRQVVRSMLIQSAPWGAPDTVDAHADAFRRSLDELLNYQWAGIELLVEHCDSSSSAHPSKSFLPIEVELDALAERRDSAVALGMYINWGRSVLDTGKASGAVEHARLALECGMLRGLGVSGVSSGDTPLGPAWADAHLPVLNDADPAGPFASTLLTPERLGSFLTLLPSGALALVKVAAPPGRDPLETIHDSARIVHQQLSRIGK